MTIVIATIGYQMKFQNIDNCHPDLLLNLVDSKIYQLDNYDVITDDGYILKMFRLRHRRYLNAGNPVVLDYEEVSLNDKVKDPVEEMETNYRNARRRPIFLQHGLGASAASWLVAEDGASFGKLLANRGYDVWLGNTRGNYFSRRH